MTAQNLEVAGSYARKEREERLRTWIAHAEWHLELGTLLDPFKALDHEGTAAQNNEDTSSSE